MRRKLLVAVVLAAAVPARSEGPNATLVFRTSAPAVVVVEVERPEGSAQGSGVVIAERQVVTNAHVVRGSTGFVVVRQGKLTWRAEVEHIDRDRDLALLSIVLGRQEKFSLRMAKKRTTSLRVGERVFAIGAPRGLEQTLSDGLVSGLTLRREVELVQTTAAVSPGSSGGGLFDGRGRLAGITTSSLMDAQNINFAVSAKEVDEFLVEAQEEEAMDREAEKLRAELALAEEELKAADREAALRHSRSEAIVGNTNQRDHNLNACFGDHVLAVDPQAEGDVVLRFTTVSGRPTEVALAQNPFGQNAGFTACAVRVVEGWDLAASQVTDGGGPHQQTISFRLKRTP